MEGKGTGCKKDQCQAYQRGGPGVLRGNMGN